MSNVQNERVTLYWIDISQYNVPMYLEFDDIEVKWILNAELLPRGWSSIVIPGDRRHT